MFSVTTVCICIATVLIITIRSVRFEAFSNVKMNQGDTLFLYGDRLYYDGNTQIAEVRMNVRMENRNTTLLTDSLNYDRVYNLDISSTGNLDG